MGLLWKDFSLWGSFSNDYSLWASCRQVFSLLALYWKSLFFLDSIRTIHLSLEAFPLSLSDKIWPLFVGSSHIEPILLVKGRAV